MLIELCLGRHPFPITALHNLFPYNSFHSYSTSNAMGEGFGMSSNIFRTDNPFFPPLTGDKGDKWESVRTNVTAAEQAFNGDEFDGVMGLNAIKILDLH